MCGIIGYVGHQNAKNVVLEGLKVLEYRGYDSAGVAFLEAAKLDVYKDATRVDALKEQIPHIDAHVGIGHTRWATHGDVSAINAHPHLSFDKNYAVVHNGVIDNFEELKEHLLSQGIKLISSTDSEVIAHMLALCEEQDMLQKIKCVGSQLRGSATFLAIRKNDDSAYVFKRGASLSIGLGKGENLVASDIVAIGKYTNKIITLDDDECAKITKDNVQIFKNGERVKKRTATIKYDCYKECPCYMRAEIDEIPFALKNCKKEIEKGLDPETKNMISTAKKITFCGCGTAYHACMYGKFIFEDILNIPCDCQVASEADTLKFVDKDSVGIFITQSGETADTLLALRHFANLGAKTLALTNVTTSTISKLAQKTLLLGAGAEIAVAATKSYVCQLYALYLIAMRIANKKTISPKRLSQAIAHINSQSIYDEKIKTANVCFIGKGLDYITAKEGALKLKEITYKNCDAYQAGELKHGTIALVDNTSIAIAIATSMRDKKRMCATISELRSRSAQVIAISSIGNVGADSTLELPSLCDERLYPILSVIPLQNLALTTSLQLGLNPDKPRNLAKSVTVI